MVIELALQSSELEPEKLQEITFDFLRTVEEETNIQARLLEGSGKSGTKGDPITIGVIVLALITSGAVTSLINVIKAYIERSPSLEIELKSEDGRSFAIRAENLSSDQIEHTVRKLKESFGEPK